MQTFDNQWETIHQSKKWGRYPSEDLIRFICRKYRDIPNRHQIRILDLGCGGGANSWFLCNEGFDVYAIDGSASAIENAKQYLKEKNLKAEFTVSDASNLPFESSYFDCVIDIACILHNTVSGIKNILSEINRILKPSGCFFSTTLINKETSGYNSGKQIENNTFKNLSDGPFANLGTTHFFTVEEIESLLKQSKFTINSTDKLTRSDNNGKSVISYYIVAATKND